MGLTHSKSKKKEKKKEKKKYTTIEDVLMCVNRLEQRLMGSEAKSEYYPTMEAQIRAEYNIMNAKYKDEKRRQKFLIEVKELTRLKSEMKKKKEMYGTDNKIEIAIRKLDMLDKTGNDLLALIPEGYKNSTNVFLKQLTNLRHAIQGKERDMATLSAKIRNQSEKVEKIKTTRFDRVNKQLRARCEELSCKLWELRGYSKKDHRYIDGIDFKDCLVSCANLQCQATRISGIRMGNESLKLSTEYLILQVLSVYRIKVRIAKYLAYKYHFEDEACDLTITENYHNADFKWPMGEISFKMGGGWGVQVRKKDNLCCVVDNTGASVRFLQLNYLGDQVIKDLGQINGHAYTNCAALMFLTDNVIAVTKNMRTDMVVTKFCLKNDKVEIVDEYILAVDGNNGFDVDRERQILFVPNMNTSNISLFSYVHKNWENVSGNMTTKWSDHRIQMPVGFKFGETTEIAYVSDWNGNSVHVLKCSYDSEGKVPTFQILQTLGNSGVLNFKNPLRMCYIPTEKYLIVADWGNNRIVLFRQDKTKLGFVRSFKLRCKPVGLAVTQKGSMLITFPNSNPKVLDIYKMSPKIKDS